jgi:hypothetical protein
MLQDFLRDDQRAYALELINKLNYNNINEKNPALYGELTRAIGFLALENKLTGSTKFQDVMDEVMVAVQKKKQEAIENANKLKSVRD